jgi:hypothetical protein
MVGAVEFSVILIELDYALLTQPAFYLLYYDSLVPLQPDSNLLHDLGA